MGVKPRGEDAVNAIDTYTKVAADLEKALEQAVVANKTISQATLEMTTITGQDLASTAAASRQASLEQGSKVGSMLPRPTGA